MNSIASWVLAIGLGVVAAISPQDLSADTFSGAEFLEWSEDGQDNYIGVAVTMATMVAGRSNPARSTCLDGWYAESEALAQTRNDEIKDTIRRNATYHPSAVILLVLEGACGPFGAP